MMGATAGGCCGRAGLAGSSRAIGTGRASAGMKKPATAGFRGAIRAQSVRVRRWPTMPTTPRLASSSAACAGSGTVVTVTSNAPVLFDHARAGELVRAGGKQTEIGHRGRRFGNRQRRSGAGEGEQGECGGAAADVFHAQHVVRERRLRRQAWMATGRRKNCFMRVASPACHPRPSDVGLSMPARHGVQRTPGTLRSGIVGRPFRLRT